MIEAKDQFLVTCTFGGGGGVLLAICTENTLGAHNLFLLKILQFAICITECVKIFHNYSPVNAHCTVCVMHNLLQTVIVNVSLIEQAKEHLL